MIHLDKRQAEVFIRCVEDMREHSVARVWILLAIFFVLLFKL